jgi:hypothetical protein
MATYNVKVGDIKDGRLVTSVNTDSAGNVIGYGTTNAPKSSSNASTNPSGAQVASDLASGGSKVTGVTNNSPTAASEKEKAGITAEYDRIMNDPNNAGIPDWLAYGKALDAYAANQYSAGGTTSYFSPGGEAEASFRGLSAEDQKKAAAQLGNPGTYLDTASGTVKNANGSAAVIPQTAAETMKAAGVNAGQTVTPKGTPAKATYNGQRIDVIIGSDGRSVLADGTPIKAGTIVEAANGKKYMRLSDNTSVPLTAYYNTIKREDENGNLIDTGRPVYFSEDYKAFDANGNRVAQGDIVTDATGKMWIMQGSQGVPYSPGSGYSGTGTNTATQTPQKVDTDKLTDDLTADQHTGDPTTDAFMRQMLELINNNPDIETMLKQGMTWEQALARAQSINNPLYAQAMEDSMNDITERALMSGMYGQLPTDAFRLQTMGKLEADKINANNTLATELRGQDIDEVYKKYNALSDQAKTKIDNYLAMLGIYTDYTRDARDYAADRADTAWNQSYQEKQLAQQQSQWQSDFEYQKLLDQLGYDLDIAKLTGVINGQPTLDALDLQRLMNSAKSSGSGGSGSGSGSGSSGSSGDKPTISEAAARQAVSNGTASLSDVEAYDYYHGTNYAELMSQLEFSLQTAWANLGLNSKSGDTLSGTNKTNAIKELMAATQPFIDKGLPGTLVEQISKKYAL